MAERCEPPQGTAPDTNHTLYNYDDSTVGETWAHWNGRSWDGLVWHELYAPLEERRATTPEYAYKAGYRYGFAHKGPMQVEVAS